MLKCLLKDYKLLILVLLALLIKFFSMNPARVERNYSNGIYPYLAKIMRRIFGWLPFSLGDLLYAAVVVYLLYLTYRFFVAIKRKTFSKPFITAVIFSIIKTALIIYIVFNTLWGLNYNRQGIAAQLELKVDKYSLQDVHDLTSILQQRLNNYAAFQDTVKREQLGRNKVLFKGGVEAYQKASQKLSFLTYGAPSIKPSMFSNIGHYIGFTGYYNPFSGEAQVKTSIPVFLKPFVVTHEIAHQLGYAKENEANFVAFLSSKESTDKDFQYSLYYNLYRYALREVYNRDTALAKSFKETLHPRVRRDNEQLIDYFKRTENPIEPYMSVFYDRFLKMNSQAKGVETYNQVVALLIAYQKKFGRQSI